MDLDEIANKLKILFAILIIFILGFLVGYWAKNIEYEEKVYMQAIEIDSLRENINRLKQMKNLE